MLSLQADPGNDDDLVLPLHVAQQHRDYRHDAAYCQRHPGESVRGPGDLERKVQVTQ